MLVGDLKLEALRLMFINMDKSLVISDLVNLYNDKNYAMYLQNMTGSINRAIDRVNASRVLPIKSANVEATRENDAYLIDLSAISDCYEVVALYDFAKSESQLCEFEFLDTNTLMTKEGGGKYRLSYYKKVSHILSTMSDNAVFDMPDEIASIIPYYIKSDLFQEDNAVLANDARNKFEQALEELKKEHFIKRKIQRRHRL